MHNPLIQMCVNTCNLAYSNRATLWFCERQRGLCRCEDLRSRSGSDLLRGRDGRLEQNFRDLRHLQHQGHALGAGGEVRGVVAVGAYSSPCADAPHGFHPFLLHRS